MASHSFRPAMTAALFLSSLLAVGPAWAADMVFQGRGAGWIPAEADPPTFNAWPARVPLVASRAVASRAVASRAVASRAVASWEAPVRLPRTKPTMPPGEFFIPAGGAPGQPADGTWREDGPYIIIHLNGRELRLVKTAAAQGPGSIPNGTVRTGGTVYGRLLHQGQPLPNCRMALSSLRKGLTGYAFDRSAQPLRSVTDARGVYCFENVPAGEYMLSWLPQRTNRWIRRIKVQPDVTMRSNEVVNLKDIRIALQTVN